MASNALLIWAVLPVVFGFWARTSIARVLTPRFITWFYRYLVVHTIVILPVAGIVWSPYPLAKIACAITMVISLYFVWYEYFNANKPDALPIGIKMDALRDAAWESIFNRIWPHRRSVPGSSVGNHKELSMASPRGAHSNLARAGDISLGIVGSPTSSLEARGKLWAWELLFKAQQKAVTAKRELNEETISTLRSDEQLHEAINRARFWIDEPHVIQNRVSDEFAAEADERLIRQREREERAAEQARKTKAALAELAALEAEIEANQRRREARLSGEVKPSETAEEVFRRRAWQIVNHGSVGRFVSIAEECRAELIAKRGGEEHLTNEDRERIELIFELARRQQESKS